MRRSGRRRGTVTNPAARLIATVAPDLPRAGRVVLGAAACGDDAPGADSGTDCVPAPASPVGVRGRAAGRGGRVRAPVDVGVVACGDDGGCGDGGAPCAAVETAGVSVGVVTVTPTVDPGVFTVVVANGVLTDTEVDGTETDTVKVVTGAVTVSEVVVGSPIALGDGVAKPVLIPPAPSSAATHVRANLRVAMCP